MEGSDNQHTSEFFVQPQDGDKVAGMVGFRFDGLEKALDVSHTIARWGFALSPSIDLTENVPNVEEFDLPKLEEYLAQEIEKVRDLVQVD